MRRIGHRLHSFSATQLIFTAYFVAVVLFTALLLLPVSTREGIRLSFVDALFVATSAVSVTGLSTVHIMDTFTLFGQSLLLVAFQFGGIGIMTLGTLLWLVLGQSVSLTQRRLIMIDQNQTQLSGLVRLLLVIIRIAIIIEVIGTVLFALYFKLAGYYAAWDDAFYYALFHSLSAYTNAGLDIFDQSLFGFAGDYAVQLLTMALIVLGAIGFPVLAELREYMFGRNRARFRFSLFVKITSFTYIALMAVGAAAIWLMERTSFMEGKSAAAQFFYSLFNSVTARSGGLATMDFNDFSAGTQFLLSMLMFVGGSPSSAGGGIRTTTFAVLVLTLISVARARKEVTVLNRTLKHDDVLKSFFVFVLGAILCVVSIIVLDATELGAFPLSAVIFEVTSAFGTTGASVGITPDLSAAGKVLLCVLMFVGRVGILTILFLFHNEKQRVSNIRYPEEKIIIG